MPTPSDPVLSELQAQLAAFAAERDWERFHSPKNLVMALCGEAGELAELFQWLTEEQSTRCADDPALHEALRHELADILLYLLRIADRTGVDLIAAAREKIALNARRYPAERCRGRAVKHQQLAAEAAKPGSAIPDPG